MSDMTRTLQVYGEDGTPYKVTISPEGALEVRILNDSGTYCKVTTEDYLPKVLPGLSRLIEELNGELSATQEVSEQRRTERKNLEIECQAHVAARVEAEERLRAVMASNSVNSPSEGYELPLFRDLRGCVVPLRNVVVIEDTNTVYGKYEKTTYHVYEVLLEKLVSQNYITTSSDLGNVQFDAHSACFVSSVTRPPVTEVRKYLEEQGYEPVNPSQEIPWRN